MSSTPRVWLITGSSTGIGYELAKAVLARGDKVLAGTRNATNASLSSSLPGAKLVKIDQNLPAAEVQADVEAALAVYGRIDVLVLNAANVVAGTIEERTDEEIRAQYTTNIFGPLNVLRPVLPSMRARHEGVVAFIGSMGAYMDGASIGLYHSTKAALRSIALALRDEVGPLGIKVIDVEPGFFRTKLLGGLKPARRIEDYKAVNEEKEALYRARDEKQLGDPKKGAEVLYKLLSGEMGEIPRQILLGSDAVGLVLGQVERLKNEVEQWRAVSESTDFPKEQRFYDGF